MKRTVLALAAASTLALATSAFAAPPHVYVNPYPNDTTAAAEVGTGAVVGTAVGVGLANGWWTSAGLGTAAASTVGAASVGGVAGVGTVALVDAAVQPCRGFHALFSNFLTSPRGCVNGVWVGDDPRAARAARGAS